MVMYCIYLKIYLYDVQFVVEVISNSECSLFFFNLLNRSQGKTTVMRIICTENLSKASHTFKHATKIASYVHHREDTCMIVQMLFTCMFYCAVLSILISF